MEDENICRLCLNVIDNLYENLGNIEQDMLRVVIPQLKLNVSNNPKICQKCWENLVKFYEFKCTCIDNIDREKNFVISELLSEELYIDKLGNIKCRSINLESNKVKEKESLCSLCLDSVDVSTSSGSSAPKIPFKILFHKCLPEVNLFDVPGACNPCLTELENQFNFINNCFNAEEKINYYLANKNKVGEQINLVAVIKYNPNVANNNLDISSQNHLQTDHKQTETACGITLRNLLEPSKEKQVLETITEEPQICDKQTQLKDSQHRQGYDTFKVKKFYKCNACNFEGNLKRLVFDHEMLYPNHQLLLNYKCPHCPYQSFSSYLVNLHAQQYANLNNLQCKICGKKTHRKKLLASHMLVHRDPSEVKLFNCEFCHYLTKRKSDLKRHVIRKHNGIMENQLQSQLQ